MRYRTAGAPVALGQHNSGFLGLHGVFFRAQQLSTPQRLANSATCRVRGVAPATGTALGAVPGAVPAPTVGAAMVAATAAAATTPSARACWSATCLWTPGKSQLQAHRALFGRTGAWQAAGAALLDVHGPQEAAMGCPGA